MFVTFPEANFDRYDVLVAGSGFAAVSVARGKRVLLIESGRAGFDGNLQLSLAHMEGRGHYDGAHWQNHWMRALGGTSALWKGWVAPLLERNLAEWPISRSGQSRGTTLSRGCASRWPTLADLRRRSIGPAHLSKASNRARSRAVMPSTFP